MNNLSLSVALATSPSDAFGELRERPRFLFPMLFVMVGTIVIVYWYYSVVDVEWLKDQMFSNNPSMTEEQREKAMVMVNRTALLWSSMVGAIIGTPVFLLLQALFLLVAAKVTRLDVGFRHWFAMSSWALLPALLSIVVTAILLILSDTAQVGVGVLQPLSVNELVTRLPMGSPGQGMLDMLSIPTIVGWGLMVIGVRAWSRRSWLFSAAFVLLPIIAIFAVWAFVALA